MGFRDPTIPSSAGDRRRGLVYPSPFFDVAQSYMPPTIKELLKWCAFFFYTDPLIGSVVYKIAEYPITDFIYNSEDEHVRKQWRHVMEEVLNIKPFLIEIGLDFFTFGNAFISINLPFKRLLQCPACKYKADITEVDYSFKSFSFRYKCPGCKEEVTGEVQDTPVKSVHDINFIRWDPKNIEIEYNPLTGKSRYRYRVPNRMRRAIQQGKKEVVADIPWVFIKAVKENKDIILSLRNLFHFKRPTLAEQDQGWGKPLILHSLKRMFYLYVLRRAQEAIALQRILPLEFIFPQANSTQDPYCISLRSLVETREGILPASEVSRGDWVKTHTGAWKQVEGVADREIRSDEKVYRITAAGLTAFPFEASEEHPIYAVKNTGGYDSLGEPDWIFAKDLSKGDYVCYPTRRTQWTSLELDLHDYSPERAITERYIYRRLNQSSAEIYEYLEENGVPSFNDGEQIAFLAQHGWGKSDYANARTAFLQQESIDRRNRYVEVNRQLAYLIGIYAAEGNRNGNLASIALNSNETSIMDAIDLCVSQCGFNPCTRNIKNNAARVNINDIFLSSILTASCGNHAQNKKLPRFITEAPSQIALQAVYGVFDGDGCNLNGTKRIGLKTTSPQLAMDVRGILLPEGLIPVVQKATPRKDEISKLDYYQVNLNGPQKDGFLALRTGTQTSPKSRCGFIRDGYVYLRIANIEKSNEIKIVRGFQIEGDKSFCVAGVSTHNSHVNLNTWSTRVQEEIRKWRGDPNYISVVPVPLGFERLGGDGRALMLGPELEIANKEITGGMGVPIEFVFGGLSWSGSSVSLRTLENHFLMYRRLLMKFLNFVKGHLMIQLGLPEVEFKFTEFKMADDVQRKQLAIQLNASQNLSSETMMTELGWDYEKEQEKTRREVLRRMELQEMQMKAQAKAQGEAQILSVKYQIQAQEAQMKAQQQQAQAGGYDQQQAPDQQGQQQAQPQQQQGQGQPQQQQVGQQSAAEQEMGQQAAVQGSQPQAVQRGQSAPPGERVPPPSGGNVVQFDVDTIAKRWATKLMQMPDGQRASVLADLQARMPNMYQVVLQYLGTTAPGQTAGDTSLAPLPEKLPPRRKDSPV